MAAANHLEHVHDLSPDEMEAESTKYLYHPLLFIKLRSGNIAVCSGLGGRSLREIIDPEEPGSQERFFSLILRAATERSMSAAEQRLLPSETLGDISLEDLLKDITL